MKDLRIKGVVCALLSGCLYGVIPIVLLNVSRSGAASGTLCYMYGQLFSGLLLLLPAIRRVRRQKTDKRLLARLAGMGLLSGLVAVALYEAFDRLPSGVTITLHYLYPLFTLLMGVVLFRQKPPRGAPAAVALAFAGVVLLCDLSLMPEHPAFGLFLAALSGLLWALWLLLMDRLRLGETDSVIYACVILLGSGSTLLLYDLFSGRFRYAFTAAQWGSLLFAGILTLLAVLFLARGIRFAGSVTASVLSTMEPIVCTLLSALVLGDPLTPRMLLGVALVLGAVVFLTVMSGRQPEETDPSLKT